MTPDPDYKALNNSWLFHKNHDLVVERWGNSISTFEREEAEQAAVRWIRDHPRRPLGEWSDLADPFEPAGSEDWSPVRSVRLGTAGKNRPAASASETSAPASGRSEFLALRRRRKVASAVAALLTGRTRQFRSDRGRVRSLKPENVPAILADLHARMDAC